jgi:hypothetical protein
MENPHEMVEHVHDPPKVNVFLAVSSCKVCGQFFFAEPTVTGFNYLDMLQLWLMPQLQEDNEDVIFQQDGGPPHLHVDVLAHLNANLPGRWIGRAPDNYSLLLLPWPPRSPDLTPCDFFLWGYIKDHVYVHPMPRDLPQLLQRVVDVVAANDRGILQHVWQELDCRIVKSAVSPRVGISSICRVGQKLGVSLPLLTCSPRRDHPGYCTTDFGNPEGLTNYSVLV